MADELMRYTVIDGVGGISFVASATASVAMAAACAHNPKNLDEFLNALDPLYSDLKTYILNGLALFDEANAPGYYAPIHAALKHFDPVEQPVFRVVDEVTREASVQPVQAGVIIFNLPAKRIIQVANSTREIKRTGRGRVFNGRQWTNRVFTYRLPAEWSLVP